MNAAEAKPEERKENADERIVGISDKGTEIPKSLKDIMQQNSQALEDLESTRKASC